MMLSPKTPKLPSIPSPVLGDAQSVNSVLLAMKQTLEMMMGTRGVAPVARVFVQETMPEAYVTGDLWVQPSTSRISYWSGATWVLTVGV